jgi:hypothetical protein
MFWIRMSDKGKEFKESWKEGLRETNFIQENVE